MVYNAYSWDANGNLTQWDDRQSNTYDLRLTYDQLDRVDNYRNFSNTLLGDMNYDPMGNITKFDSVVGSAIHYTYNSSNKRLISVSGYKNYAFSYDERGNIVDNGRDTLTYNLAGQVTSIGGYDYVYDAHNRRVKTIDTQGVRYSMYTLSGKLIHERINGANRENYYLGSQLVAHQGAGEKKYIHPDVLGGTAATTNAAKSPERTRYAPYGSAWGHTPKNEIGYPGHKQDSDTGLVYMQARYYDPVIGRFYSNDPVGYTSANPVMSFNRYLYVNNNPYKYTDPNGEFLKLIKSAWNIGKRTWKNGGNVKKAFRDEVADNIENVAELLDGDLTFDDAVAAVDLIAGGGDASKTVGRWMSPKELTNMRKTGRVQEGGGGQTRVADPSNSSAYGAAPAGDSYVEFDVPASRVKPHSQGTGRIPGPNSPDARASRRSGGDTSQFEMPEAKNIREIQQ